MQYRSLIRARNLAAFRATLADVAVAGDVSAIRRRAVIVPTRAAGELLRQTIESRAAAAGRQAVVLPDLITREDWLRRLHQAVPHAGRWATRIERETILARVAGEVATRRRRCPLPFQLRPGLVAAMLDFLDELLRRQRTVRRFARALFDDLRVERGTDQGSEHLIDQTRFLGFAFLAYGRALAEAGCVDEHALRRRLVREQPALPFDHLVMAVADHPADPRGLWSADFDLVGRLRSLTRLDVIMTDEAHDAGFRARLEEQLPGIEEVRAADVPRQPRLVVPATESGVRVFVSRDREEELRQVARVVRTEAGSGNLTRPMAVVFHRPLPYLYLAQHVFTDARIPYQTFDALPLAAEPYAALVDVTLSVARTGGTREAVLALLRSTLLSIRLDDERVMPAEVSALEAVLAERRVSGEATTYADEVRAFFGERTSRQRVSRDGALRAARAARAVVQELDAYRHAERASDQLRCVAAFLRQHEQPAPQDGIASDRYRRARAAVLAVLDELADSCRRHDDRHRDPEALTGLIHHALEAQTFTPRRGTNGVHLVDAVAARFGEFADVHLVGLVETEWPERVRRTVFYASGLLKSLGWPQDTEQVQAQQAAFRDVLTLARDRTRLSAFQLEGDAVIGLSPMVDAANTLEPETFSTDTSSPLFADELLTGPWEPVGLGAGPSTWLALRRVRPTSGDRAYSGFVDPQAPQAYRVSKVDHYVDCPFRYFSENVLQLPEERDEHAGLTPLERGTLLHELFETFYRDWQAAGHGAITSENLPEAVGRFSQQVRTALAALPAADRALEEMRLLGSIVARGVGERVFELEADANIDVRERLLEREINGTFEFPLMNGMKAKAIAIRGKADRIDVLVDGMLRVVDYKLGQAPDTDASIQIAVYAFCARQMLQAEDGRSHPVHSASYLAFGDDRRLEASLSKAGEADFAVDTRANAFAAVIEHIEAGEFPARPRRPGDCQWCQFAGVCRKEYLLEEEDESAEPV